HAIRRMQCPGLPTGADLFVPGVSDHNGGQIGRGRMDNRRKLLVALGAGAVTAPFASFAQAQTAKVSRMGILSPGAPFDAGRNPSALAVLFGALRESLRELGGLMAYGPNRLVMFHHAATFVDKILKGAKPDDLPIEQPTNFELVINFKAAKALGLTIPQALLLRAEEVIQ
ncbi:MAG: hypothetical protein E6H68_18420, partial [Betaproteobacteria bacterium]